MLCFLLLPLPAWLDHSLVYKGRQLEYQAKDQLGLAPKLDRRLKILAIEDQTVEVLGDPQPTVRQWKKIIQAIAKYRPGKVIVDGDFKYSSGDSVALKPLKKLKFDIIGSVDYFQSELSSKYYLSTQRPEFYVKRLSAKNIRQIDGQEITKGFLSGPNKELLPLFTKLGHGNIDRLARFRPLIAINKQVAVQHFGLFAANELVQRRGTLLADKHQIPMNSLGVVPVNLVSSGEFGRKVKPLSSILLADEKGKLLNFIKPGDVVLITAGAVGNNVQYVETPVGAMERFKLQAAIVNSAITGNWSGELPLMTGMLMLLGTLGFAAGVKLRGIRFAAVVGSGIALVVLGGMVSGVIGGLCLPWLAYGATFALTALPPYWFMSLFRSRSETGIRGSFEGAVTPAQLQQFILDPDGMKLQPTEQIVTVMFIDIAGFSNTVENQTPQKIYYDLRTIMENIRKSIHSFGGIIVGNLGDGVLCFFGYGFDGKVRKHHVPKALACAVRLQQEALRNQSLNKGKDETLVFPLRIGINTAAVYFGDLGANFNTNMTMIGEGVNFTRRLQAACEPYRIMVGPSTYDALKSSNNLEINLIRRMLHDTKYDKFIEAYEYDPSGDLPDLVKKARPMVMQIRRRSERFLVPENATIEVTSKIANGKVRDFSTGGLAVELDNYLSNHIHVNVWVGREGTPIHDKMVEAGLNPLLCEVRWGRPLEKRFFHGLEVKFLSEEMRSKLISLVRESF